MNEHEVARIASYDDGVLSGRYRGDRQIRAGL